MLCMSRVFLVIIVIILFASCNKTQNGSMEKMRTDLDSMVSVDQDIIHKIDSSSGETKEKLLVEQQRIIESNTIRVKELLQQYGFPGHDVADEQTTANLWLLVQHADHDVQFQKEVLALFEQAARDGNAPKSLVAYLKDRTLVNEGLPQIYATQLTYDSLGNPYPKPVADSANLDALREAADLEPLRVYLVRMRLNTAPDGDTVKVDVTLSH